MRRLVYIPFVLVFLMQAGCTLSMEEYIVPEEDRGQGELYTQQEEFGTISYQFKDSVLSVTDNIQEKYLVRVESDSILYFSDQIPQQWRPYVGMKLASHITHALPWGLNHKVIAVENLGGILKVTATKVSSDEIYEDLKIYLDAPVGTPDLSGLTEEELKDYGYELMIDPETGDSVIMDWNDYDVARGVRPAGAKRKSLKRYLARTRGDDDEKKPEEEERTLPDFKKGESGPHTPTLTEKMTTPPPYFTEATLLRAMETAGKLVDDEELRAAMKENGIGRPSTRAAIIETLFKRHYIRKERKRLVATPTGIELIDLIHEELLKSAELTGIWEKKLRDIEAKKYDAQQFIDELKQQVTEIVSKVLSDPSNRRVALEQSEEPKEKAKGKAKEKTTKKATKKKKEADDVPTICPVCGKGHVIKGKTAWGCSRWKEGCTYRKPFDE